MATAPMDDEEVKRRVDAWNQAGRNISAAHGMIRANREGWRDHLMIGGHIHQDEPRMVSHPDGFKARICQVSAFKEFDNYADVGGLNGPKISPVWDLVAEPAADENDPDRIKVFWDSDRAEKYFRAIA